MDMEAPRAAVTAYPPYPPKSYGNEKPAPGYPVGQPGGVAVAHVEPASPVSPTYTAASQPPMRTNQIGSDFNTQDGFNVQWLLFILGFFFYIPSIVGAFLPLCQTPRFPNQSYRGGWIANVVIASVYSALWIILAATVGSYSRYYCSYYYC